MEDEFPGFSGSALDSTAEEERRCYRLRMFPNAFSISLILLCIGCGGREQPSTVNTSDPGSEAVTESTAQASQSSEGLSQDYAKEIVSLSHDLEAGRDVSADRIATSVKRINEAKGFTVVLCANVLAPLMEDNETLNVAILALITSAAAMIEQPELESNLPELATASLESLAKIYSNLIINGGTEIPGWNQLVRRIAKDELAQWVSAEWACPMTVEEARGLKPANTGDSEPVVVPYEKQ